MAPLPTGARKAERRHSNARFAREVQSNQVLWSRQCNIELVVDQDFEKHRVECLQLGRKRKGSFYFNKAAPLCHKVGGLLTLTSEIPNDS